MKKEKLYFKYNKGQERSEVVERENFTKSIFAEQYSQAIRLIDSALDNYQEGACQIIAFCGDRGEGKSSCLKTIHEILKKVNPVNKEENDQENIVYDYLKSLEVTKVPESSFEVLDIIDPAFFDKGHNVQELVVGQMYTEFRKLYYDPKQDRVKLNEMLKEFEKVKHCVTTLKKAEIGVISEYDELETLAYSMTLKQDISNLIKEYLEIKGKKDGKLVITVDDIDLNMEEAYRMCEQIRKYFGNQYTIIILAVKIDQLHQAVARALQESSQPNTELSQSANVMAEKYLAKFLPAHIRINMPSIFDICGRYLQIGEKYYDGHTIMDTILELIFQRTRYLFYNSMGVVSPLIPTNLRSFLQLLGLISEMHNLDKYENNKTNKEFKRKLEENKHRFKNYFFIEWLRKLPQDENLTKVQELINLAEYTLFNKKVCGILNDVKSTIEKRSFRNDDEEDDIIQSELSSVSDTNPIENVNRIIDKANFSYNVTIGDVFYIINMLEKLDLTLEQQNLLFFIKSLYSMRLYEAYDTVTEIQQDQYSDRDALHAGIYRYDSRLTDTNELQRLVGGSYFSYPTGSLLRVSKLFNQSIDCCIIETSKGINELSDKAKKANQESWSTYFETIQLNGENKEEHLRFLIEHDQTGIALDPNGKGVALMRNIRAFRLMELFALTVCQTITQKEMERARPDKLQGNYRTNVIPVFLSPFAKTNKRYMVFDVLSPFANLINPKFSYSRWEDYVPGFYETAIRSPWSLLRKMIGQAVKSRLGQEEFEKYEEKESLSEEEEKLYLHILQSDGIIRNGEVLAAMFENINGFKSQNKDKSGFSNISAFYSNISSSNMSTYSVSSDGKNGYPISFSFLKAIEETVEDSLRDYDIESIIYSTFNKVVASKNKSEFTPSYNTSKEGLLIKRLIPILPDKPLSASEIRNELSKRFPAFAKLSSSDKRTYINLKDGEKKDIYGLLAYITSYTPRMKKWYDLLGI